MKHKILLIVPMICLLLLVGCKKEETDAEKFAKEYTQMTNNNYFVYKTGEEIIKILENGTGVVYLGFPECKWCQAYVPLLNEVADMEGLEKIYYYDILEPRKNNTQEYQKIVEILKDYLQYDNEGNKRIYVPAVIFVSKGEIVSFDDETSYDTKGFEEPEEYWTTEEIFDLKEKLTISVNKVLENKCTECNE